MTDLKSGAKPWQSAGVAFYQDASRWDVPRAADGPANWPRVSVNAANAPRRPVSPAAVSHIRMQDDRISFDVDRVGVPVLVKTSYFPNWTASGAKGPWRVTPNQMVVVPTSKHVSLHYGYSHADLAGHALTFLGLAGAAAFAVFERRRRKAEGGEPDADGAADAATAVYGGVPEPVLVSVAAEGGAQAHETPNGADAPPEDGRAGRSLFDDGYGDLGHDEPGPLGPQDQLGVEEVGTESALFDDR
jgi:hypothetical protein